MPNPLITALEESDDLRSADLFLNALEREFLPTPKIRETAKVILPVKPSKAEDWSPSLFNEVKRAAKSRGLKKLKPSEYTSKPTFEPVGKTSYGQEYFGVELEVEAQEGMEVFREEMAFDTNRALSGEVDNFCIIKHDGSLRNGFEICTRPATITTHKKSWKGFFEALPNGLAISERCGMHVHISKAPLTELQIGKIIAFIHNPENAKFLKKVAGRASCHYSNYSDKRGHKYALPKYSGNFSHYSAVNILNPNTVELRIFSSAVNYAMFLKNLEFCHALTKFAGPGITSIKDSICRFKFLKFVNKNRRFYPYLTAFLYNNGYSKSLTNIRKETKILEIL